MYEEMKNFYKSWAFFYLGHITNEFITFKDTEINNRLCERYSKYMGDSFAAQQKCSKKMFRRYGPWVMDVKKRDIAK